MNNITSNTNTLFVNGIQKEMRHCLEYNLDYNSYSDLLMRLWRTTSPGQLEERINRQLVENEKQHHVIRS